MNDTISYDQIPQVLKDIPNWVLWQIQVRDGKETKVPLSAHKQNDQFVEGKSNDSKTWADFSTVKDMYEAGKDNGLDGIGFVLGETEFAGVDIDDCRDPQTGRIEPWAQDIINQLNSYTEVTPSKCGVRVWLKGKLPATHKKRFKMGPDKGEVEIYCRGRYFTCTGHHLENTPTEIMERPPELQKLHDDLSAKKRSVKQHDNSKPLRSPEMSDEEILEHAKRAKNKEKFEALWNGDITEYNNDDSRADMALVDLLSFWTQDPEQIDRLYRKSALMRGKWDEVHSGERKDYSEMIIDKALDEITEVYQAPKKEKGTQPVRLFKMAMQEARFFQDSDGEFYAEIQNNGHQEIWSTGSGEFKRWLPHQFRLQENTFLNSTAIDQVIRELEYYASQTTQKVFTRVGGLDGDIYLDLCNERWEAVKITKDGWSVINNPPVKFRRAKGMLPILPPEHSYVKLKDLQDYLNVKNPDDLKLVIGWLLGTLHPSGPYALLELAGESGSSKSTLTRFLRSITDPNMVAYKTFPKDEHDFAVAGKNCWIMAFDNISYLQDKLSDSLCRMSTGEGFGTRKLYTDTDEIIFWLKRPVIMNGITEVVSRGDLLDRMMLVELTPIPEEKRIEDSMMARKLEYNKGAILGDLLNIASQALKNLEKTRLEIKYTPRMADFIIWVEAGAEALGWKKWEFSEIYRRNQRESIRNEIQMNPLAKVFSDYCLEVKTFEMTPTDLLKVINEEASDVLTKPKTWPKNPGPFSRALKRFSPALRAEGIELEWATGGKRGRERVIKMSMKKQS